MIPVEPHMRGEQKRVQKLTDMVLCARYDQNQSKTLPQMPTRWCNPDIKMLFTVPKAVLQSSRTTIAKSPESLAGRMLVKILNDADSAMQGFQEL